LKYIGVSEGFDSLTV